MAHMQATEIASGLPSPPVEGSSEPIAEISATLLRAQAFLSGCGIALMVREGAWLVCRASSGAASPEIGARMAVEHSFLGLCVTLKKPQSCEDTDSDPRVENVTYSRLRPKSILAVPVRSGQEVLAVLAGFSAAPNAFTHTQIAILRTVADSLSRPVQQLPVTSPPVDTPAPPLEPWPSSPRDSLQERAAKPEAQPVTPPPPPPPPKLPEEVLALADEPAAPPRPPEPRLSPPTVRVVNLPAPRSFDLPRPRFRRRFRPALFRIAAITAACLLCALVTAGWYSARIPDGPRVYTAPVIAPVIQPPAHAELLATPPVTAVPVVAPPSVEPKQPTMAPAHAEPQPATAPVAELEPPEIMAPKLPSASPVVEAAPSLAVGAPSALPALVAPHAAAPKIHHSEAAPARLEHRVAPQYPAAALSRRIAGEVMVSLMIRKDGSVADVKLRSGNPLLGDSAIHAVKQWRYSPATLDGQAVEATAQVVLKFELPRAGR